MTLSPDTEDDIATGIDAFLLHSSGEGKGDDI